MMDESMVLTLQQDPGILPLALLQVSCETAGKYPSKTFTNAGVYRWGGTTQYFLHLAITLLKHCFEKDGKFSSWKELVCLTMS